MVYVVAAFFLPPLLIFGVYQLALWFDIGSMSRMPFWRRVALTSAIAHTLLVVGFFVFLYLEYRSSQEAFPTGQGFGGFMFSRSEFWPLMSLFDTVSTVVLLGLFGALDRFGAGAGPAVPITIGVVLLVGTLQWYWVGGGLGLALDRLWSGLQSDDDGPDWL